MPNSYVPPDSKLVDHGIYEGNPVQLIGENFESFELMMTEFCSNFYKNIIIMPNSSLTNVYNSNSNYNTNNLTSQIS